MRFVKMHGLGNDYVYLDCFDQPEPTDAPALARFVSDRHFGIGSDGLILVCRSALADAKMRMFNADGSESEMCGNGIRCVAKLVYDHGLSRNNPLKIETGRGVLTLHLNLLGGKVETVRVDMGEPILDAEKIPTTLPGPRVIDLPLPLPAEHGAWRGTCVSMGNPHVTIFCDDLAKIPLERVGPVLETLTVFPRRINVHFVQVISPREVIMRTWERGSGITMACGTGACAVAVAGVLTGRTGRQLLAHLPGGDLLLEWASDGHVYMTGPATQVFTGELLKP
ncbi:MAG: diaminopimelate epimerase [Planctomycetia bacterium]|nr:diaminopimelate epimerase [Planctomycetia bacterium]